jgi:hypothetical protein
LELNEVVTSKTSFLAIGAISKLPDVVQLCKVNNPAMAKSVIIFSCFFNFMVSLIAYIHELCKVYYVKLCSFEVWIKTQIIHGNKKAVRQLAELQNNTILELVLP